MLNDLREFWEAALAAKAIYAMGYIIKLIAAFGLMGCSARTLAPSGVGMASQVLSVAPLQMLEPIRRESHVMDGNEFAGLLGNQIGNRLAKELVVPFHELASELSGVNQKLETLAAVGVKPSPLVSAADDAPAAVPLPIPELPVAYVVGPRGCGGCDQVVRFGNKSGRVRFVKVTKIEPWISNIVGHGAYPFVHFKSAAGQTLFIWPHENLEDTLRRIEKGSKLTEAVVPPKVTAEQPAQWGWGQFKWWKILRSKRR